MRKFGKILVALVLMLGLGLLVGCSCEKEKEQEKVLEGITVTPASLTLDSSDIQVLEVKPVPADAELPSVEFISSDSRIASVGKDGKVMGLRAGTAEITVKVGEFTKKVTVTVNPVMPTALTLSKTEVTLKVGEKVAITYKVEPQDTTDQVAAFASDNEAIATVSAEGEITAVAEGETVVTVSLGGLEEEVAVTVNPADVLPASVRIKPLESNDLVVGETLQLEGFILPPEALQDTFVWASNNEAVATVSAEGLVTALAAGEVEISLSLKNYPNVPAAKVTLNCYVPLPERLRVNGPDKIVVIEGELYEFTVSFEPDGTYTDVTWSVDDETKATIDPETGKVTALAPGPLTITATSTALAALKASKMIIVEAYVAPEVTVEGKTSIGVGLNAVYKATVKGNYLGPNVTWSVSDEAVLSIDGAGNVTGLAAGTANVIAASVDDPEVKGMLEVTVIDVGENLNVLIKAGVEDDGGTTEYDGVTYYNGINALPNLTDVAPLLRDGSKIFVLAGEYASNPITITAKNVSLIGPNAGISAVDGARVPEAKISGKITLDGADNFTMDGFHIVDKSPIRSTSGLNKLTIKNNHFDYVGAEGGGGEGVIFLHAAADAIEYHDVLLQGNLLEENSTGGPGFRGLRARNVVNLTILDNKFIGFYEPVRIEATGGVGTWNAARTNEGSGAGLGGKVLIQGNVTENVGEYPLFFGRVTADEFDILHNTINLNAASQYSYGTMMFTNIQKGPEGVQRTYNIKYNNFMFSGGWHGLRIDSSECLKENLIIDIQWNKWLTEHNFYPDTPDEDGLGNFHEDYVISRFYTGYQPEDPEQYPIYVANNFYQSKPEDYMFTNIRRDKTSYFLNEAEFDYYRGVQLGAAEEFKVFYDSDELYEGETLQLRATKDGVTYASSADAVATVDAAGLVTAVAAGDVNITATLGTDEVVVALKVLSLVEWDKTIGLVDPALAGEKGDPVVVGEKTYHVGYNAFKDLELMMAAAQANQTITVLPGAYDKAIEIKTNGLTLVGPLADKDPTVAANQADFADPAKAAQIQEQMYVLADNITIKGFSFNGPSRVQFFKKQSNFVFEYNYVDNPTYTKPTILFKEGFQGTNEAITDNVGGGFIHGGGNAMSDYMINFRIERNLFKNVADTVVYLCMPENLEFNHNILDTYDIVGLRLDFGSTYGTYNIKNNTFKNGELFGFYSRGYGTAPGSTMNIEGNVFDNVGNNGKGYVFDPALTRIAPSAVAVRNYKETGDATFSIKNNDFLQCAMALSMRNNYASTITFTFTSEVKYNAFINTAAPEFYQRTRYATDTEATNPNDTLFDYNFFGSSETVKVEPTAAQLQGAKEGSNANNFDTYAALVAARP
jgi:uncharacterized protein YjdB